MRNSLRAAVLPILLLLSAEVAQADLKPGPAKLNLGGVPAPAVSGVPFEDVLLFRVNVDTEIRGIRLDGPGWRVTRLEAPARTLLLAGDRLEVPFGATPSDPAQPLVVHWIANGEDRSLALDLSPEAHGARRPKPLVRITAAGDPVPAGQLPAPGPEPPDFPRRFHPVDGPGERLAPDTSPRSAAGRTITVTGQVVTKHEMETDSPDLVPVRFCSVWVQMWEAGGSPPAFGVFGTPDADGRFSIEVDWLGSGDPWVRVQVFASNPWVVVQENDLYENTWSFVSATEGPVAGDSHDLGLVMPSPYRRNSHAALYIAEIIGRQGDFFQWHLGQTVPAVEVLWPETDGSYFSTLFGEIHIDTSARWNEGTYLHEWGHHWNDSGFAYKHPSSLDFYCNGICDDEKDFWFDDCGHCIWCEESGKSAWNEGLAQFVSRYGTTHIAQVYSSPPDSVIEHKEIETFVDDSRCDIPEPHLTEGSFAAAMWDLHDSEGDPENDPAHPTWADAISGCDELIFDVLNSTCADYGRRPRYPLEFLNCFLDAYPTLRADAWKAFMNNGFDLDEEPPGAPVGLTADPVPGVTTTDNTVEVSWTWVPDDASGPALYSVEWAATPALPDTFPSNLGVWSVTSTPLDPGTWYCSIRARDRAGRWSDTYASIGPFLIQTPIPADLRTEWLTGWDYNVVPRADGTASPGNVHVSSLLNGEGDTWWSVAGFNSGTVTSPLTEVAVQVDGEVIGSESWPLLAGGNHNVELNLGPVTVPGGRHIFGAFLDSPESIAEPNEGNNHWAGQWVWRTQNLSKTSSTYRPAPPPATGGLDYFRWAQPFYYNCDGYRLSSFLTFQAATLFNIDQEVDYDLKLFDNNVTPEGGGFATPLAVSERPAGSLDAVLVNGLTAGVSTYQVGLYNVTWDGSWATQGANVRALEAQYLGNAYGTYTDGLSSDTMMHLYTFYLDAASGGQVIFRLRPVSGGLTYYMAYFPPSFTTGGILDAAEIVSATSTEPGVIHVSSAPDSIGAVAVWQEPGGGSMQYERTFELTFEPTPCDLRTIHLRDWGDEIVPRADASIGYPYTVVPAPATLTGGGSTYLYYSLRNQSLVPAPAYQVSSMLDGEPLATFSRAGLGALANDLFRGGSAVTVPGGRHTLGLDLDPPGAVEEVLETNNRTARQWVWSPEVLAWNGIVTLNHQTDPVGGWDAVDPFTVRYYNSRGYRTPALNHRDGGIYAVVMAAGDAGVDVDLRLHAASTGAADGFAGYLASSTWNDGPDYIVVDEGDFYLEPLDAALVLAGDGGAAAVEVDHSGATEITGEGTYGPYVIGSGDLGAVHQVRLPAGNWRLRLLPESVVLDMSLHPSPDSFSPRLEALATSWGDGGEPGTFEIDLEVQQTLPLVVWRSSLRDLGAHGSYRVEVELVVTGVGGDPGAPVGTRVLAATPNPFRAGTEIVFESAREERVAVTIHGMTGAIVKEISDGVVPPGRHEVSWDGCDSFGRPLAAGIYFARVSGEAGASTTKLIKLR